MTLNFENPFFVVLSITSIVIILIGFIFIKFPPKEINFLYGYRTARARKNQENWDFAQKHSAPQMVYAGIAMAIISLLGLLIKSCSILWMWIGLLVMTIVLLIFSFRTETALKKFEQKNS